MEDWFTYRKLRTSGNILLMVWFIATGFFLFCYSCNLRALLVKVAFEDPIETSKQIDDQKIDVYFPGASALDPILKYSPFKEHNNIRNRAVERGTNVKYQRGAIPPSLIFFPADSFHIFEFDL